MYKILVVEDEPSMLSGLEDNLEFEGYEVDTAAEGHSALEKIRTERYHLVVLDVMLPGISGFEICKKARKEGITTPIILLTARGEEMDKVRGLELGADDYITKPFSLRELLARIKAILRRSGSDKEKNAVSEEIEIGNLKINFDTYEAFVQNQPVKMTHKEFEVLRCLWNSKNHIISRDDLLLKAWGDDYQPVTRTVDNFIVKLRQKIEHDPNKPKHIITVHGIGYKLIN